MGKDKLGTRMKTQYEHRCRQFLPRRTYTIVRLDGKAFHTFTKGFDKPYDLDLMTLMDETAKSLCEQVQGVKFAYVQSDEITLLLTDFEKIHTNAYFDGNVQKITSISASIATAAFNKSLVYLPSNKVINKDGQLKTALFDSRVFTIPDRTEVENCFIWRQMDATKNSISMLGQAHFTHKELHGKNGSQVQDMLMTLKDINWNDCPTGFKRGRVIVKENYQKNGATRNRWIIKGADIFTKNDRNFFEEQIPRVE